MNDNTSNIHADPIQQPGQDAAPDQSKAPRNGKRPKKIKRTKNSFRPDLSAERTTHAIPDKIRILTFYLPSCCASEIGDEHARVGIIAEQLFTHTDFVMFIAFNICNQTWEVNLILVRNYAKNEDHFLSDAFRTLMPTIEALPDLRNGFCVGQTPTWAYSIDEFVVDQGRLS